MGKKFEPTKVYGPNRPDPTRPASNAAGFISDKIDGQKSSIPSGNLRPDLRLHQAGFISDKIETDNELTEILQGP